MGRSIVLFATHQSDLDWRNKKMLAKVCKISEVSEGSLSKFDVQGKELLVTKIGVSYFVAST